MRETLNLGSNNNPQTKKIIPQQASGFTAASLNQSFEGNKEGLNFLQIRLNDAERTRINKLKEQIRNYLKENLSGGK
jgi:hypothetical protein